MRWISSLDFPIDEILVAIADLETELKEEHVRKH
jgi:hypothetical protein